MASTNTQDATVASPAFDPEVMIFCNPLLHKTTTAVPMGLGEYLELRGWSPNGCEDLDAEGYLVERPEMGPPNHQDFKNFIAWLPKENFDRFYEPIGNMNS